jgi:hemolysin activation/secretion protein
VGRHAYTVQLLTGTDRRWASWSGNYTFSGLSKPILSLAANRTNDERVAGNADGELAGTMLHRATNLAATATFLRNRIRVFSFLSVSAEKQQETFTPEDTPDSTLQPVLPISSRQYTGLTVIGSWSNTQRPIKAISFEDGVLAQGRLRQRWMAAGPNSGLPSFEGLIHGYKSLTRLGLPNHVVAIRIAGAYSDDRLGSPFSIGGGRSAALNVIDGFVLQNVERPYFIRGTPDGVQSGSRAVTVSAEYRWPMFAPSRGLGLFPAFLDRVSGSIFADAGHAWCSKAAVSSCQSQAGGVDNTWAQAVGAELSLSSAFLRYDTITQLRLGIASSISPATRGLRAPQVYAALGIPF